jgi:transposase
MIADEVGISDATVLNILHEDLRMNKVSARWILKLLNPDQKIMLLRDNCRVHKARQIREVFDECGFVEMEQPAYSPDLAPSDYYLFLNFFFFG